MEIHEEESIRKIEQSEAQSKLLDIRNAAKKAQGSKVSIESGQSSDESGSSWNTQEIMKDREKNSIKTKRAMSVIMFFNIMLSLAQIPLIIECDERCDGEVNHHFVTGSNYWRIYMLGSVCLSLIYII